MKIAIGTQSQYKINAILKVLSELDVTFTYSTYDVDSGVSEQPLNDEVARGSINRAERALALAGASDIGIGIEFGYVQDGDRTKMLCYASIADNDGKIYTEHSSSLELPATMVEALSKGVSLHTLVEDTIAMVKDRQQHRAFSILMTKRRFIYESCENVMLRYLLDTVLYSTSLR